MKLKELFCTFVLLGIFITGCIESPYVVSVVDKNQKVEEPEPIEESEPEPEPEIVKQLTLMVYMAADNDLESYALQNLNQMEMAVCDNINVLVLLDRSEGYDETDGDWKDTRLFEVCKDISGSAYIVSRRIDCPDLGLLTSDKTELDMSNPYVLKHFVEFVKKQYITDKYALIIWGHGTGWRYSNEITDSVRAVAIDDKNGSYMKVSALGSALRGQGLNVIGFDTCFGGVFENIYELKNCAEFTVASPGITPASGWDYKRLLEEISSGDFSSQTIANQMCNSSSAKTTVFSNSRLDTLMNSVENFSKNLALQIKNEETRRTVFNTLLATRAYKYTQYPCDMYLDIYSMAENYAGDSNKALANSAEELKIAVCEAIISESDHSGYGIGIHFIPLVSSQVTAVSHSFDYIKNPENLNQCSFIKESEWWVPTHDGKSGSLLNKIFYSTY